MNSSILDARFWIIQHLASSIQYQTPVFRGEEKDSLGDAKNVIWILLSSRVFLLAVLGIIIVIGLFILYKRRKSIPELEVKVLQEDTWFITRDDNKRVGIVVSVSVSNKSPKGIYITDCKLSGYSARENTNDEIPLEGLEDKRKLSFPAHKHFYRGQEFYLGPYASEPLWLYYESRIITMVNLLETAFTVKDSEKRRKTIRLRILRHADQMTMYQEMNRMF